MSTPIENIVRELRRVSERWQRLRPTLPPETRDAMNIIADELLTARRRLANEVNAATRRLYAVPPPDEVKCFGIVSLRAHDDAVRAEERARIVALLEDDAVRAYVKEKLDV